MLPGPHSTWHIGEEVAFEGDAVRRETWLMVVPKVYSWKSLGNSREGNGNGLKVKPGIFSLLWPHFDLTFWDQSYDFRNILSYQF